MKSSWPIKKLGEVVNTIESGKRPRGGAVSTGIPSLGVEHVTQEGEFNFRDLKFIPEGFYEDLTKGKINYGDILIAKDGATTGKTAFVERSFPFAKAAVNEHLFIIRGNKRLVLQKFLFFFLLSPIGQNQILKNKHGAAQGGIDQSFINFIKIPLPSLKIQQKIVERLDAIKKAQELNDKQIELAEELFQSLLHRELDPKGKNWEIKKLKDLTEIHYGKGLAKSDRIENGKYFAYGSNGPVYKTKRFLIDYPTIVIGRKGAAGALYLTKEPSWPIDTTFYVEIKNKNETNLDFLFFLLQTMNLQHLAIVTAVPGINRDNLYNLKIPLPPIETQRKIVEKLSAVQEYKKKLLEQKQKLQELFESVLNKFFNKGELVDSC